MICDLCLRHPHEPGAEHTDQCREREAEGMCCNVCRIQIRDRIDSLTRSLEIVSVVTWETRAGDGRSSEPTLPGGTDRLDWLVSVRATITSWTRAFAEDWNMSGPKHGDDLSVLGWLRTHHEHACTDHPALAEFADEIRLLAETGEHMSGDVPVGQRIICPTDDCETRLRVDIHKGCDRHWTTAHLMLMTLHTADDAWVDPEAASIIANVDTSTLRRWARAGHILRKNGLYELHSITARKAAG